MLLQLKHLQLKLLFYYYLLLRFSQLRKTVERENYDHLIKELNKTPERIKSLLNLNEEIEKISAKFKDARNFLYLGRGVNFPVALEGFFKA